MVVTTTSLHTTTTGHILGTPASAQATNLDQQRDALTAAGVDPDRLYTDKLSGTSTKEQRPA